MGNSNSSHPGPKCLPKPTHDDKFLQELTDKGVYFRSPKEDGRMWNVSLPKGWGYLECKTKFEAHSNNTIKTGKIVDAKGYYIATIVARYYYSSSPICADASIYRIIGNEKIETIWSLDNHGYVYLNKTHKPKGNQNQ